VYRLRQEIVITVQNRTNTVLQFSL